MTEHMPPLPPTMAQPMRMSPMDLSGPPNKRPRLTTDFPAAQTNGSSPAYGPPFGNTNLVPYSLPPSPYQSFNTPQSPHSANMENHHAIQPKPMTGVMGPPEKPKKEQPTDINDLSDLVFSAGVDLKEEENYLTAVYTNKRSAQPANSFQNSFHKSQGSSQTLTPESSFGQWSNSPSASQLQHAAQPSGALNQPTVGPEEFENAVSQKHKAAARHQAESKQKHLNDPFLFAGAIRDRMHKRTYNAQVRLRQEGLNTENPKPNVAVNALQVQDGSAVLSAKVISLNETSSLVDILSLISLATQERVRGVLEDTYAISRARRYGSGGIVPPEFADIAVGSSKPEIMQVRSESVTGTAWDAPPVTGVSSTAVKSLKRKSEEPDHAGRPSPGPPTPPPERQPLRPTVRFPSRVPSLLHELGNAELELERKRLLARRKREDAKNKKEDSTPDGLVDTPDSLASIAPIPEIKISKKERERQAKASQTEEVLRKQANQTAHLALGKSKKYSWLTGGNAGGGAGLTTGAGQRERLAAQKTVGTKKSGPSTPAAPAEDPGLVSKKSFQKIGLLKESPGLHLRDLVNVLERDAKEKKALVRAYQRLNNET